MPDDDKRNLLDLMSDAQRSVRHKEKRPVDVLVNRIGAFEQLKDSPLSVGNDVVRRGVLIYGQSH